MTKFIETVLPCVPGCDVCQRPGCDAWGVGGDDPHSQERKKREVSAYFVEIEYYGTRKLAIAVNQPPNCEGRHRETLLFPLDEGMDSDDQRNLGVEIIRRI